MRGNKLLILTSCLALAAGCKTAAPDREGSDLKEVTATAKGYLLTGKGAENLTTAISGGDRLQNDGKAARNWQTRFGSGGAEEGYFLGTDSDHILCEYKNRKYSCQINLKSALARGYISTTIVSGQPSLFPNPITLAAASANTPVVTEWLPPVGPSRVDSGFVVVEGSSTGWKVENLNLPVYDGADAKILCGTRGTGLSDTACLFVFNTPANPGNAGTSPSSSSDITTLDLTAHDTFSIGIQNVLYKSSQRHPDVIGSKQDGNHGKVFFYKGQDAKFSCWSFKCEFTPSPWRGKLARALRDGMADFDIQVIGNKLAGPHIYCEGTQASPTCHYRFEENPFLALQEALKATSSVPGTTITKFNTGDFNQTAAKNSLTQQFNAELPGCPSRATTSRDTALKELVKRANNDARVKQEVNALKTKLTAALAVYGSTGEECSYKALVELYHTSGYKALFTFEQ